MASHIHTVTIVPNKQSFARDCELRKPGTINGIYEEWQRQCNAIMGIVTVPSPAQRSIPGRIYPGSTASFENHRNNTPPPFFLRVSYGGTLKTHFRMLFRASAKSFLFKNQNWGWTCLCTELYYFQNDFTFDQCNVRQTNKYISKSQRSVTTNISHVFHLDFAVVLRREFNTWLSSRFWRFLDETLTRLSSRFWRCVTTGI